MNKTAGRSRRMWFGLNPNQLLWTVTIVGAVEFAFTGNVVWLVAALIAVGVVVGGEAGSRNRR